MLGSLCYYPYKFPSCRELQAWANKKWKIPAGVVVKELNDEYFLFEFPSRVEAERIKMGKWMFENQELFLDWWSQVLTCNHRNSKPEKVWIKLIGFPSHLWSENIFEMVGDRYGGFPGIDEDTKNRSHLRWARICVKYSDTSFSGINRTDCREPYLQSTFMD